MKQYLDQQQTAKLIEMGFEKPKNERWVLDVANESTPSIQNIVKRHDYSIGELIEMLGVHLSSIYYIKIGFWVVNAEGFEYRNDELIDALFAMIVKLKEEDVFPTKEDCIKRIAP